MERTNASGKDTVNQAVVLVKGFENRPATLRLVESSPQGIVAQSLTGDATIGLHRKWVFRWDENLLAQLDEAYERSDSEALSELWSRAEPLS